MPTPLEILLDPVSLSILGMYLMLMLWETLFPAQKLPKVKGWHIRSLLSFAAFFYLSSYLPILINPILAPYRLIDATAMPMLPAVLLGVFIFNIFVYAWHRAIHKYDVLWRTMHQMHHSAERIDTFGAFYLHPFDVAGLTVIGSICFALIMGFSPQTTTAILLVSTFLSIFEHTNVRTPYWLGFLVQRPESHSYHHERGAHRNNYCSIPLIDMVMGTFHNPRNFAKEVGFYDGASARVVDMLFFKDVSTEPADQNEWPMAS